MDAAIEKNAIHGGVSRGGGGALGWVGVGVGDLGARGWHQHRPPQKM